METKYSNFDSLIQELTKIKKDFYKVNKQLCVTERKNEIENIISNLDGFINRLKQGNRLSIVNMGIVKAGKSEFFNALIEEKDTFQTGAIPTTRDLQKEIVKFKSGYEVVLIDTPGLDVSDSPHDEEEALKGYQQADLICFVHNPKNGEYDRIEIKYLKYLKSLFTTTKHPDLVFILTKQDEMDDSELTKVRSKCREQIQEYVNLNNPQIFSLSSKYYLRGIHDNDSQRKDLFIAESNFMEFKNWLDNYVMEKIKGLNEKRIEEFEQIREKAVYILNEENLTLENEVNELKKAFNETVDTIHKKFQEIQNRIKKLPCDAELKTSISLIVKNLLQIR